MQTFECVSSSIERGIIQIVQKARHRLFVTVPCLNDYGVATILDHSQVGELWLLTNLNIKSITSAALDIGALLRLWDKLPLKVSSLSKPHAKVYIADEKVAMITSANLTRGGLRENYGYGVIIRDEQMVATILRDMIAYFNLGNIFKRDAIESLAVSVEQIRELQKQLDESIEARQLRKAIVENEAAIKEKMLVNRVRDGRTVNAIFSETIMYLLEAKGALSTQELHGFIQSIHPDICDDTIDRVINGQHFGKKWKHLVRNAQQFLRRKGDIFYKNGKWCLGNQKESPGKMEIISS